MASEREAEVVQLRARVAELERQLEAVRAGPRREKIHTMSAEVVDSNPYRLVRSKWSCLARLSGSC